MQFCGPDPNFPATATYREMDMRFWLEQAEVEMRALARRVRAASSNRDLEHAKTCFEFRSIAPGFSGAATV
jgi:hypothetical protein